jgi:hypothetical protein
MVIVRHDRERRAWQAGVVKVYLVDGTYELFRQYFGRPSSASPAIRRARHAGAASSSFMTSVLAHHGGWIRRVRAL